MSEIEFRSAKPEDAEEIAELYKNAYGWEFPLTEYSDSRWINQAIKENRHIWQIALNENKIVGSSIGIPHKWNNSVEIGRTIIDKGFYNRKIAKTLCERVKNETAKQEVDICWGHLRNKAIYNIAKHIGMTIVGYLPGLHKSEIREMHLMCMYLNEAAREKRKVAENCTIYESDTAKEITKELGLKNIISRYPKDIFVNTHSEHIVPLRISHYQKENSTIINSIGNFDKLAAEYLQVTVLADKTDAIQFFSRFGFKLCAFLPAWFEKDEKRYDCVTLCNYETEPTLLEELFQDTILKFKKTQIKK